jgi:putative transcriptional regulator
MPIIVTLDVMLARRKMRARELAARIGLSETQLSLLRTDKVRGIRFGTLARICAVLECTLADLLDYAYDPADLEGAGADDS